MELEFHQLAMKYEGLRMASPAFQARLMVSLAAEGQQQPVLVVQSDSEAGGYVLIDGYRRVSALRALTRDTVEAMLLPLGEVAALIFRYCQQSAPERSALEEGWFLRELTEVEGMSRAELSRRLQRSESWVSRRLSLVRELPESVQQRVRSGELCSHAAAKYLVPLARAKRLDCEKLGSNLAGAGRISDRQMQMLYTAYRSADAQGRSRVVANPLLFLKSAEQLTGEPEQPGKDEMQSVLDDLQILDAVSGRARRRIGAMSGSVRFPDTVIECWKTAQSSFAALSRAMEKRIDAGQRNQSGDLASAC
jgi:ParB/RepB/Spo0J family partition protein